jgi:hypothetical protein
MVIFSHLVHASDADQLEALLTRWGPNRKLGGKRPHSLNLPILVTSAFLQIRSGRLRSKTWYANSTRPEL